LANSQHGFPDKFFPKIYIKRQAIVKELRAYTLLNASLNFKPVKSKASYFLSGHNLTDKEYLASRVDGMSAGRGRQVFGGIRFDFN
jgi:outer membrane receptor protein involved in Fe transport